VSKKKADPLWNGSSNMNPKSIGFWSLVREDFVTHNKDLFSQGFFALFVHRFGNWRMGLSMRLIRLPFSIMYLFLAKLTQVFCGIKLDYTVHVGRRVKIEHFGGMILGARSIGNDVVIRQNTTFGIRDASDLSAKPIIEDGVNVGAGAVIVGDITIGHHSKIAPNTVVIESIPPFSTVFVKPTVIIKNA
jgi:serine O-acetyltransferase